MSIHKRQRIIIFVIIVIIIILGIGYLLISSNLLGLNKDKELSKIIDNQNSADDNILQAACKNALNDYPQWAKTETDIIIWENPDKNFYFRNSPEDQSAMITSPIPPEETLVDMDFIGLNEISYVTTKNNNWKINLAKLNWPNSPDKSQVYEKSEQFSSIHSSPISKNEFIVLVVNNNRGLLRKINTENKTEEIMLEIPLIGIDHLKLAVSSQGTDVYLIQDSSLFILEIASKKQIDKINSVESAVWIGNDNVLYSGELGTFVYNLKTKEKNKLDNMEKVSGLTFNPKDNGIIAFNENGNTKIIGCQKLNIIKSKQGSEFKALTSEKTAITKKGKDYGYWRFKDRDWGVKILEEESKFVTVWQRY